MSEILVVSKSTSDSEAYWLILDCGHWYQWADGGTLNEGNEFLCPWCKPLPVVVRPEGAT